MLENNSSELSLQGGVRVRGRIGGRNGQSRDQLGIEEGKSYYVFQKSERSMRDLVKGEMFANGSLDRFPHKGTFGGVELYQQRTVAKGDTVIGTVGDRLGEPGRCRVNLQCGADNPKSCYALSMFYQKRKGG